MTQPDDGTTEVEEWVVTWFPPDQPDRSRAFTGERAEEKARAFAARNEPFRDPYRADYDVAQWNPLLEHRVTIMMVTSEIVPL